MKNETSWKVHSWIFWERAVEANTTGECHCFEAELVTDSDLKTTTLFSYGLEGIKRGEESRSPLGI